VTPELRVIEACLKALHAEILAGTTSSAGARTCRACRGAEVRKRLPIAVLIDAVNNAHKRASCVIERPSAGAQVPWST